MKIVCLWPYTSEFILCSACLCFWSSHFGSQESSAWKSPRPFGIEAPKQHCLLAFPFEGDELLFLSLPFPSFCSARLFKAHGYFKGPSLSFAVECSCPAFHKPSSEPKLSELKCPLALFTQHSDACFSDNGAFLLSTIDWCSLRKADTFHTVLSQKGLG